MPFTSLNFLVFIVCLFVVYFILHKLCPKFQWAALLVASYVFYLSSSPEYVIFLLLSTLTTWGASILMGRENTRFDAKIKQAGDITRDEKKKLRKESDSKKRLWLVLALVINIGVLVFLKYTNFLVSTVGSILSLETARIEWLILPLGISFYTFQAVGYCVDVYRGVTEPEKNPLKYALYVSFFPQISQGPIGKYTDLAPQLYTPHAFDYDAFIRGAERIIIGYFKKMVVADNLATFIGNVYSEPAEHSGLMLAFATLLYAFQLYADFSGYMDIALGISSCMGIKLAENFETPYFSTSIAEFWRRWHISLGTWFREYLYYPVLRSRVISGLGKKLSKEGKKKLSRNLTTVIGLFVTWLLIGFWHGSEWKFVVYGLYHGMFVILASFLGDFYAKTRKLAHVNENSGLWKAFQVARTFFIVWVGYVLFRASSLSDAMLIYKRICSSAFFENPLKGLLTDETGIAYWLLIAVSLLICFIIEIVDEKKIGFVSWLGKTKLPVRWIVLYILLFGIIIFGVYGSGVDVGGFLYEQF